MTTPVGDWVDEDAGVAPPPLIPEEGACFVAGEALMHDQGAGTCSDPMRVDLTAMPLDDSRFVTLPSSGGDDGIPPMGKCGQGAGTDRVVAVRVPAGNDLEISVEGTSEMDPVVRALDGGTQGCGKPITVMCIDGGGVGACEYTRLRWGSAALAGGVAHVVVSEISTSGRAPRLHLRLRDPGSGS